jgi:hypothetical protein
MRFYSGRSLWLQIGATLRKSTVAERLSGKPVFAQFVEMARLAYCEGKIRPSDYYNYELYNDELFSFSAKREFLGSRGAGSIYAGLNNVGWRATARDKVVFHLLMKGAGLPTPRLCALYSPLRLALRGVTCMSDSEDLLRFLRGPIDVPFFAKPIRGAHGRGGTACYGFDATTDCLQLRTGKQLPVQAFVDTVVNTSPSGYLFQECLAPHAELQKRCGTSVSTIRIVVLLTSSGPIPLRAVWRIPCGENMTDNFNHGTSGNLIGQVDVATGRVVQVLKDVGLNRASTEVHPDTGRRIAGIILPQWEESVRVCLEAAILLPEIRLQGWDVAISSEGPKIIEVNDHGDFDLVQYAYRSGVYDTELRRHLTPLPSDS